jgi:hypothetical protein
MRSTGYHITFTHWNTPLNIFFVPNKITFDPSREIEVYFRVNRAGNPKAFVFVDANGAAYDISGKTFEFFVKDNAQSTDKRISLTVANGGLNVSGAGNNRLNLVVTEEDTALKARTYYCELYEQGDKFTWLNGRAIGHNGTFDGVTETTGVTVNVDGDEVTITVEMSGGDVTLASLGTTLQTAASDTPLDADTFHFWDAVESILKKVTWTSIKATLKAYFDTLYDASGLAAAVQSNLTTHTNNTSNPHSVTKAQVGLGNADNTSDANKPVSSATQTALDAKLSITAAAAAYQPLDSDLTAIALLSTTAYGRAILTLANAAAADWVAKTQTINGQALSGNIVLPLNDSTYYTQSGKYITGGVAGYTVSTNALVANTLRAYALVISKSVTVTEILTNIASNVAATVFRVAIYTDNGGAYPDALVAGSDAAEYDSSTNGNKSSGAVSIVLAPGLYWVAINSNGAPSTRAIPVAALPSIIPHDGNGASTDGFTRYTISQAYGVMPSTFPAGATSATAMANRVEFKV